MVAVIIHIFPLLIMIYHLMNSKATRILDSFTTGKHHTAENSKGTCLSELVISQ